MLRLIRKWLGFGNDKEVIGPVFDEDGNFNEPFDDEEEEPFRKVPPFDNKAAAEKRKEAYAGPVRTISIGDRNYRGEHALPDPEDDW